MAINFIEPNKDGSALRVGIVVARFNEWACNAMLEACLAQLKNLGVKEENITVVTVPALSRSRLHFTSFTNPQNWKPWSQLAVLSEAKLIISN